MEAEIIHAVGVWFDVRERASNIIHAAGVRGVVTSSTPQGVRGAVISFPPQAGGGLGFRLAGRVSGPFG